MNCQPHFERAGETVEATRVIDDRWFCEDCYMGKPVFPYELEGVPQTRAEEEEALRADQKYYRARQMDQLAIRARAKRIKEYQNA